MITDDRASSHQKCFISANVDADLSCRVWCGIPQTRRAAARLLLAINVDQFVSLLANNTPGKKMLHSDLFHFLLIGGLSEQTWSRGSLFNDSLRVGLIPSKAKQGCAKTPAASLPSDLYRQVNLIYKLSRD